MKAIKSLTFATLAFASVGTGYSQTFIRIVASNGDRTATQTAISKLLTSWNFRGLSNSTTSSTSPATPAIYTNSNYGVWNGTFSGQPVVIKVSYSGALAGVSAVAGNTQQRFVFSDGTGTGSVKDPTLSDSVVNVDYESNTADFGLSTNFQSTSPFLGVYKGTTYSPVIEEIVGVSPLGFYASPGFPNTTAKPANITTQVAQQLYKAGTVSLQLFTGDVNDRKNSVWALGRNTDAGQRYGAYAEVGLGARAQVTVWKPTITGQLVSGTTKYGGTSTSHILWPAETVNDVFSPEGSGGYTTAALLTEPLTTTLAPAVYKGNYIDDDGVAQQLYPDADAGYYVGYVTPGDANSRILPFGGVALRYNGVELTDANVRNGSYTAWLYNRIIKPQSGLTGLKLAFADALRDQIRNVDAPSGGGLFNDASFKVERFTDGGIVTLKP